MEITPFGPMFRGPSGGVGVPRGREGDLDRGDRSQTQMRQSMYQIAARCDQTYGWTNSGSDAAAAVVPRRERCGGRGDRNRHPS